jgi:hypothetical protein
MESVSVFRRGCLKVLQQHFQWDSVYVYLNLTADTCVRDAICDVVAISFWLQKYAPSALVSMLGHLHLP